MWRGVASAEGGGAAGQTHTPRGACERNCRPGSDDAVSSQGHTMGQGQSGLGPGGEKKGDDKKEKRRFEPPPPPTRVGKKQRRRGVDAANKLPTVTPSSKCKLRLLKLERVKDYLLMEEEFVTNQERLKPQEARAEEERTKVDDLRGTPMSVGSLEELIDDKCVPCANSTLSPALPYHASRARHRLTAPAPRSHAIVSSSVGPESYVNILSFVDKSQARESGGPCRCLAPAPRVSRPLLLTHRDPGQLEPGCSVLLHSKSMSVVGILSDEADPLVSVMKARATSMPCAHCARELTTGLAVPCRWRRRRWSRTRTLAGWRSRSRRSRRRWSCR